MRDHGVRGGRDWSGAGHSDFEVVDVGESVAEVRRAGGFAPLLVIVGGGAVDAAGDAEGCGGSGADAGDDAQVVEALRQVVELDRGLIAGQFRLRDGRAGPGAAS